MPFNSAPSKAMVLTPEAYAEQAAQRFRNGANCAQAVLSTFAEVCGLDDAVALRLASGFGGGVGRQREVCGAVSGMVLVANWLQGYSDLSDKSAKDRHYALIQKLCARFRAETGSIICRELLAGHAIAEASDGSATSSERTEQYYRKRPCGKMVALAARIVAEELLGSASKA